MSKTPEEIAHNLVNTLPMPWRSKDLRERIAAAITAERAKHRCSLGLDDTPTLCSAGSCMTCINARIVAERERAEAYRLELATRDAGIAAVLKADGADYTDELSAWMQLATAYRAEREAREQAEAERDEARQCVEMATRAVDLAQERINTARNTALREAAALFKASPTRTWDRQNIASVILALIKEPGQ